jgi:hypothetical protein
MRVFICGVRRRAGSCATSVVLPRHLFSGASETFHQLCFRDNPLLSLKCLIGTSLVSELFFVLSCFRPEPDSLMLCGVQCARALRNPPCFP